MINFLALPIIASYQCFHNQLALFVNKVSQIAIHLAEIVGYNKAIN